MWQSLRRSPRLLSLGVVGLIVLALVATLVAFGARALFGGATTSHQAITAATIAPATTGTAGAQGTVYTIDSSLSQATFTIHEVLFGNPNTVVGKTSQVAGQIRVDQQDPAQSVVGQIRVDVSTLVTDNNLRNNIIRNQILETTQSANQYATFTPTALVGLPTTPLADGKQVSFQIVGKLTLHQVTRPATFAAVATLTNATTLTGSAQTTVKYADYNISVPNVPSVTGLGDTTVLAITFTAHP